MIKFLHCADLHLDSPLRAADVARSEARRSELRAAFTSLIMSAKMSDVDFLFIAGDLFDGEFVSKDTVALLCREFASIPSCNIIIAPGNHDPYSPSGYYRRVEFPPNVYIFDSPEMTSFDFPDKNTTVYGYAFTSDRLEVCPADSEVDVDGSRINILVAHGEYDTEQSVYCPLPKEKLAACGFDYVALGHRHSFTEATPVGSGYAAYSGCLEGRGFDECGIKGAIMGAIEKSPELKFASKLVRYCKRYYIIEELDVSGAKSNADVLDKLAVLVESKRLGEDCALRVVLKGEVAQDFVISEELLSSACTGVYLVEIVDMTVPLLDADRLASDMTLRGEFYRSLKPLLESDNEEERSIAASALRCGLAALSGNDFTAI